MRPPEIVYKTVILQALGAEPVVKTIGSDTVEMTIPPSAPEGLDYFIASTEEEDRHKDIIRQDGWVLDWFQRNPVWMEIHDYRKWPLGRIPFVQVVGKALIIGVEWDEDDPHAAYIQGKYQRGFARACSVGFRPIRWEYRDDGGWDYIEQRLIEVSAVPIGQHPGALGIGTKGIDGLIHYIGNTLQDATSEDVQRIIHAVQALDTSKPEPKTEPAQEPTKQTPSAPVALYVID